MPGLTKQEAKRLKPHAEPCAPLSTGSTMCHSQTCERSQPANIGAVRVHAQTFAKLDGSEEDSEKVREKFESFLKDL